MTRVASVVAALFAAVAVSSGAGWQAPRRAVPRTGARPDDKLLSVKSASKLVLLWKRQVNETSRGLTDPLLFGPFVTHRGIKELVFVEDATGTVYAVDADLGTVFWSRKLGNDGQPPQERCEDGQMVPLAISPAPKSKNDDEFENGNKPVYAFGLDSVLYALRPSTGEDFAPPLVFVPAGQRAASLAASADAVSATTGNCGAPADRLWRIPASDAGPEPGFVPKSSPLPAGNGKTGASVMSNGVIYSLSLAARPVLHAVDAANGRELYNSGDRIASGSSPGKLALANGHICFSSSSDATIYCFGLPFQM